jgi:hypothetical protein
LSGNVTVNYHVRTSDHFRVYAQSERTLVFQINENDITSDLTLFAEPVAMVELLSEALTLAQELVDRMQCPHADASRPGPGTRSLRSVLGAGASAALPESSMAEGGT